MENHQPSLLIGKETSEFLKISVLNYERIDSVDYWDANWLKTQIKIKVGAFIAEYSAQLQTINFTRFRKDLERLYIELKGVSIFDSLEDWIKLKLTGDGIGHFELECEACDFPGTGNRLEFTMTIDQTEIPELIRQLTTIIEIFPEKGQPI